MPSDFNKLLKLSCFKKELLRFFFEEIEHPEYAPIIGENILYCAINNECKKLNCKNGILKNERVPELYEITKKLTHVLYFMQRMLMQLILPIL